VLLAEYALPVELILPAGFSVSAEEIAVVALALSAGVSPIEQV
jgi:hypothetical protein